MDDHDDVLDRSSPTLRHLPGGQIAYQSKPMTSMNTTSQYPFCTVRPEQRQLLGYNPPSSVSAFHDRHLELTQAREKLYPSTTAQRSAIYSPSSIYPSTTGIDSDSDDDEATYVPVVSKLNPSQRVSNYIDEITNTPEMEQVEAETKKIRADAAAILQKLQAPTSKLPSSKLYTTYDFSKLYKSPTNLEAKSSNDYYGFDADEEHYRARKPAPRKSYLDTLANAPANNFNPYEYIIEKHALDDPVAKMASEIDYRSLYSEREPSFRQPIGGNKYLNSYETTTPSTSSYYNNYYSPRENRKIRFDSDSVSDVRNNIAIRAQYASNRAAANVGTRKFNDYLMN